MDIIDAHPDLGVASCEDGAKNSEVKDISDDAREVTKGDTMGRQENNTLGGIVGVAFKGQREPC